MSRVLQENILVVVGTLLLSLSAVQSEATVFKWRDDNGKIHFTDDPNRVPEKFRQEKIPLRPLSNPQTKIETPPAEEQIEAAEGEEKNTRKTERKKEVKKTQGLTATDKTAAEAAIAFFKADIPRYEAIYKARTGRRQWASLRLTVMDTIPQKEALVKQLSASEFPLLKEITGFLQKVIVEDEKLGNVLPLISKNTRPQVNKLSNRLKEQTASEEKFLEKLEEVLLPPPSSEKK